MLSKMRAARTGTSPEYATIALPTARLTGPALGLDIGGTGIKAAIVDLATGQLVTDRVREPTPRPATPKAVLDVVASVVLAIQATGKLTPDMPGGAGFPSVIRAGRAMTATHGNSAWIGVDVGGILSQRLDRPMAVLNDADAAGVAETAYGAAKGQHGVVLLLDLGTGIGSALFTNGRLVPNIQLGHLELHGRDAETRVSPVARKRRRIGWKPWAAEFNELLARYEAYIWPDLIIISGGLAKDFSRFGRLLKSSAPLVAAAMGTTAGIVGAARVAGSRSRNEARSDRGVGSLTRAENPTTES